MAKFPGSTSPLHRPADVAEALSGKRCPVCGASDWLACDGAAACSHCRLVVTTPQALPGVAGDIAAQLAAGTVDLLQAPGDGWWTDDAGLRNLAWRFGYVVDAIDGGPVYSGERAAQVVARKAQAASHAVTLAIMARADDRRADALHAALSPAFAHRLVLLDAEHIADYAGRFPGAVVAAHPLADDFAAQRNRMQAMAATDWILQVDTDETPDAALIDSLGWLTAAADRDGLRSLGLPRRNHVDGRMSALYPDIQYRLNRADVRFAGHVHERPVVPFAQTSLALCGALDHRLDGDRVRERTRVYEAMSPGAGRPEDEALLLEPFDAIAVR